MYLIWERRISEYGGAGARDLPQGFFFLCVCIERIDIGRVYEVPRVCI